MSWTKAEWDAIGHFAQNNNLTPQLSYRPFVYFVDKDGKQQKHNIHYLVGELTTSKKQEKQERDRAKREEERKKKKYSWQ